MNLYARVFSQILDSSLAEDWQTRHVFEDILKLAVDGVVDMTRQALARRTNVPIEVINRAIEILESPDPVSRDPADDGCRLARLDEHRDWGWSIVNWEKYEGIRNANDQRAKARERKQRQRERQRQNPLPSALPSSTEAEAEAEAVGQNVTSRVTRRDTRSGRSRSAEASPPSAGDEKWLAELAADPTYEGIDVRRVHGKMVRWCQVNGKQPTRRRFTNWLNREDRPMRAQTTKGGKSFNVPNI